MKQEKFAANDGTQLHLRSWQPANPRAVVVIVHGFKAHGGLYE
ncbi:hypothetical protein [Nannocystis pusilla]